MTIKSGELISKWGVAVLPRWAQIVYPRFTVRRGLGLIPPDDCWGSDSEILFLDLRVMRATFCYEGYLAPLLSTTFGQPQLRLQTSTKVPVSPGGFVSPKVRAAVASARTTLGLGLVSHLPDSIFGPGPSGACTFPSRPFSRVLRCSLLYVLQTQKAV
ncbi:hypothetical protein EDB87DRAFT_1621136 [Lactarius vividus]|nr:hypothetical protein EDB87DRAFT_1621136 [Lactarius vividus]